MIRSLALTAALLALAVRALANPGELDPYFGNGGVAHFKLLPSEAYLAATAIQEDGRIVSAGTASAGGARPDIILMRQLLDGRLDPSFGDGGRVTWKGRAWTGLRLLIQPDGGIVLGGLCAPPGSDTTERLPGAPTPPEHDVCLARFQPDGTLDASFGTASQVRLGVRVSHYGMALAPGGGLALVWTNFLWYSDPALYRAAFTKDGAAVGDRVRSPAPIRHVEGVVAQPDGKLLVFGPAGAGAELFVARLDAGGLDPGFGTGGAGLAKLPVAGYGTRGGVLQPDGRFLVGACGVNPAASRIVRLTPEGAADAAFGEGGRRPRASGRAPAASPCSPTAGSSPRRSTPRSTTSTTAARCPLAGSRPRARRTGRSGRGASRSNPSPRATAATSRSTRPQAAACSPHGMPRASSASRGSDRQGRWTACSARAAWSPPIPRVAVAGSSTDWAWVPTARSRRSSPARSLPSTRRDARVPAPPCASRSTSTCRRTGRRPRV